MITELPFDRASRTPVPQPIPPHLRVSVKVSKRHQLLRKALRFLLNKLLKRTPAASPSSSSRSWLIADIYRDYRALRKPRPFPQPPSPKAMDNVNSRRQRLLGIARQTRDQYLPRIQTTVLNLTAPVAAPQYDSFGRLVLPPSTQITLFPTYTKANVYDNDRRPHSFDVHIHGWVLCPGTMTRKNRLLVSLARQVIKNNNPGALLEFEHVAGEDSDAALVALVLTSLSDSDDTIKQRLANFMARLIAGATLEVTIGSVNPLDQVKQITLETDGNGHFKAVVLVPYPPLIVRVEATNDELIFAFQEPWIVANDWSTLGVISDIDDTVKMTGVVGDKRDLLRLLLCGNLDDWRLDSMIGWYRRFGSNCSFHYVLNLPWQLLPLIQEYFERTQLPPGSFHLKQYTGNIIALLMEPSMLRKRQHLEQIIGDFDQKEFICIGDLGEYDLEAYVDAAKQFPTQIMAIYIRFVEHLLSDVDDARIFKEITRMVGNHNRAVGELRARRRGELTFIHDGTTYPVFNQQQPTQQPTLPARPTSQPSPPSEAHDDVDLIDLDSPVKPRKPSALKGKPLKPSKPHHLQGAEVVDRELPPPLPARPTPAPTPTPTPTQKFSAKSNDEIIDEYYFMELEETDKRGAQWLLRIRAAIAKLKGSDTKLRLFRDDDPDFFHECDKALAKEKAHVRQVTKNHPTNLRLTREDRVRLGL